MDERLKGLFTNEQLNKIKNANILIVGLGGVGTFCFETLIRSGIKNITIIDNDFYEISNLNRQLHSSLKNIGKSKVEILKEKALEIDDSININTVNEYITKNSNIEFSKYDFIIDCIDFMEGKVYLIKNALLNNIPIISSMGAGNRTDMDKIIINKLKSTEYDPMAKKLRSILRKENISLDIPVCFSKEPPVKSKQIFSYIGVSSIFGIKIADYVIKSIIK